MAIDVSDLVRSDILHMPEYAPIVPLEILSQRLGIEPADLVKLDGNENPYGPSPKAHEALARYRLYHIYPDPNHSLLRQAIANYIGVDSKRILCGAGSDELLDLVMRLFLQPGDAIVDCPPTFGMYAFDAGLHGATLINVWRNADFSLDVDGVIGAVSEPSPPLLQSGRPTLAVKLLFLNSPNNPDGRSISEGVLRRILNLDIVVVLDEAYAEFGGSSHVRLTEEFPNLIVLRTFSKWAGLAGLRLGYGVFPEALMPFLWKIKQPYNVNVAAQVAALASLSDIEYLQGNVRRLVKERERLYGALQSIEYLHAFPSQANFILCRVLERDAHRLKLSLEERGILIRHFQKARLHDCVRISVGRPEHTDMLMSVLKDT